MAEQRTGLPARVDVFRLADAGKTFSGDLTAKELGRLLPLLANGEGTVHYHLAFYRDAEGRAVARVQLDAQLALICQRCMRAMPFTLAVDTRLAFFTHEVEVKGAEAQYEPVIVAEDTLSLTDTLEDEILLGLPQVAMHAPDACKASTIIDALAEEETPREDDNPFAALAALKQKDTQNSD
ncbi:MAG TPA: DNA-binding protein [Gammaproteobacteria bacterium]|nr:DNA-binding protein [Gammaproteobacteria bacterium]